MADLQIGPPDLPPSGHEPVLLRESLSYLAPAPGRVIVDCTLGRAGHASHLAPLVWPDGQLIAIDADLRNLEFARGRLAAPPCRFFHANFAQIDEVLASAGLKQVDGIFADLGISTNQLFDPDYGMSFSQDMPLDMRLDPSGGASAADIVNRWPEEEIANLLFNLAQERLSRRIARKIGEARRQSPIQSTERLAEIVRGAVGSRGDPGRIDPATRTFLALRMHVNQELKNLSRLMEVAVGLLRPAGRMVVISFQSMEDRLVKQKFRSLEQTGLVKVLTGKPVVPDEAETDRNPRSRSAKLRAFEKLA